MYDEAIHDVKTVHLLNWYFYDLAYKMFLRATESINKVSEALPAKELELKFNNIEDETFKQFFGEMVKAGRDKKYPMDQKNKTVK